MLGCITLGSALGGGRAAAVLALLASAGWGGGGRRRAPARAGSDGGQLWDSICLSSASSEVVGLGNENIIKFCQKVARSRIDEVGSLLHKFKICESKILQGQTRLADHHHHEML